jgi:hypothetical protein
MTLVAPPAPVRLRARPVLRRSITAPRVIVVLALLVWTLSLPALASAPTHPYGLLFAAGPGLTVATVLVIVGFVWSVWRRGVGDGALALAAYITIVRLPGTVLTAVPIYSWTYKHLGIVDYIMHHGSIASGVDIYSGWPGFFAGAAWFSTISGIAPVDFAHWFTFGYHLVLAAAIFGLARAFGQSARVALVAAFIAEAANWVAQDYFSPQALGFLFAVVLLTLLLRSRQYPVAGWLTVPLFTAITVSHQLTPYWLIGIAIVLGITGHIRPRYIGAIFAAIALGYLALNLDALHGQQLLSSFNPVGNAQTVSTGGSSPGHDFSLLADRIVSLLLWAATGLVVLVSIIRNRRITSGIWVTAVLSFSSFVLFAGENYGGEAVFRVFLYSIPGCSLILAPVLTSLFQRGWRTLVPALLIMLITGVASLEAYFGGWYTNLVTENAYQTSVALERESAAPTTFVVPAPGAVGRATQDYVRLARAEPAFEYSLTDWNGWRGETLSTPRLLDQLTSDLRGTGVPADFILTKQMVDYSDYYGLYPPGALQRLLEQLRASKQWVPITDTADVHIFRLKEE